VDEVVIGVLEWDTGGLQAEVASSKSDLGFCFAHQIPSYDERGCDVWQNKEVVLELSVTNANIQWESSQ